MFLSSEDICFVRAHYWTVDHVHLFHCLIKTLMRVLYQESWSMSFCAYRHRNDKVSQYYWQKCHTRRVENTEKYFSCFLCWSSHMSSFVGVRFIRTGHDARRIDLWWMTTWWSSGWLKCPIVFFCGIHRLCPWLHRTHILSRFLPSTVSFACVT